MKFVALIWNKTSIRMVTIMNGMKVTLFPIKMRDKNQKNLS